MSSLRACLRNRKLSPALFFPAFFLMATNLFTPRAVARAGENARVNQPSVQSQEPQSQAPQPQGSPSQNAQPQQSQIPATAYDKAIFEKPIPSDQLAFLKSFEGAASGDLIRNKQYRKLMHSVVPNCMFHYGRDMPLPDALEKVLTASTLPVAIRDQRYLMVSGRSGPYLSGRGFMWIDLQDGIALGRFYFHPTNGEPTPTVTIFSKQVKEKSLRMSQLPPAFAEDLTRWSEAAHVPLIGTRYFISARNEKILLEHDEDYCAPAYGGAPPPQDVCEQMDADAADLDLNAAYYLDQTHHATNATAWMIVGQDQIAWIQIRENTCRIGPDPVRCRIRMTRERTRDLMQPHPAPHPPHA